MISSNPIPHCSVLLFSKVPLSGTGMHSSSAQMQGKIAAGLENLENFGPKVAWAAWACWSLISLIYLRMLVRNPSF